MASREPVPEIAPVVDELLDALGRTGDAMIAVDGDLRVVGWNEAATELFGYEPAEVVGRACREVLEWSDRCGNAVCADCMKDVDRGPDDEIVATCDVVGYTKDGRSKWLSVTTVVPRPELRDRVRLVHLVREVPFPIDVERILAERAARPEPDPEARRRLERLTPREREVLGLLAEGKSGGEIAEELYVSPTTVRNHVQHILGKLEVHSRVEAVALYLRNR